MQRREKNYGITYVDRVTRLMILCDCTTILIQTSDAPGRISARDCQACNLFSICFLIMNVDSW